MDLDLSLRDLLINDFELKRQESKYLFDYYSCKNKECLIEGYTDNQYNKCINSCSEEFQKFQKLKAVVYKNTIQNYYFMYNQCMIKESKDRDSCIKNLLIQDKTLEQVKKFLLK